jgi:DNA-binding PadR family transcriptional regulator
MTPRRPNARPLSQVDLEILLSLAEGPLHGYGIKLDIAERTQGKMRLGSGTLYEGIQRLENRQFIAATPPPDGGCRDTRRRYYRLKEVGERALKTELARMADVVRYAQARDLILAGEES